MHAGGMDWNQDDLNEAEKWREKTGCNIIIAHVKVQIGVGIINYTNRR